MTAATRNGVSAAARPVTPVAILAAELTDLCCEVEDGCIDQARLLPRLRRARDLAAGLDPYLEDCTTPESPALADLARRTRETDWDGLSSASLEQEMLSGHVEGQLLKFLVRMRGARRVLEIGMFTGYSALAMAEALPYDGVVIACELDAEVARLARASFDASAVGRRIHVEVGPAMTTLGRLVDERVPPFDLVFIDADKPGYRDYLEFLLDSPLLAPGAVVAVDNTLLQGEPWAQTRSRNGDAIASFNAAVTADPRVEQVLLPLRDGLTLIRRVDDIAEKP